MVTTVMRRDEERSDEAMRSDEERRDEVMERGGLPLLGLLKAKLSRVLRQPEG